MAKKSKKEKAPEIKVVTIQSGEAFCPKATFERIRSIFQAKPSPKMLIFPTPSGKIEVTREAEKGATAKWFSMAENGRKLEGTKKAVMENVAELITVAHRQAKMKVASKTAAQDALKQP